MFLRSPIGPEMHTEKSGIPLKPMFAVAPAKEGDIGDFSASSMGSAAVRSGTMLCEHPPLRKAREQPQQDPSPYSVLAASGGKGPEK